MTKSKCNQLPNNMFIAALISAAMLLLAPLGMAVPRLGTDADVIEQLQKRLHDDYQWYLTLRSMELVFAGKSKKEIKSFFNLFERLGRPSLHGEGDMDDAMQRLEDQVQKVYGDKLKANPKLIITGYDEFKVIWKDLITEYRAFPSKATDIKVEDIRVVSVDREAKKSVNEATVIFHDLRRRVEYTVQDSLEQTGFQTSMVPLPRTFEIKDNMLKIQYP